MKEHWIIGTKIELKSIPQPGWDSSTVFSTQYSITPKIQYSKVFS